MSSFQEVTAFESKSYRLFYRILENCDRAWYLATDRNPARATLELHRIEPSAEWRISPSSVVIVVSQDGGTSPLFQALELSLSDALEIIKHTAKPYPYRVRPDMELFLKLIRVIDAAKHVGDVLVEEYLKDLEEKHEQ